MITSFRRRAGYVCATYLLTFLGGLWCLAVAASGQGTSATLTGTVSDSSGAVVPGAGVTLENVGTHETRSAESNGDGLYNFRELQPGEYVLSVRMPGFSDFSVRHILLAAGDSPRVDLPLKAGGTSEHVEVVADVTSLQSDTTNVGSTITGRAVQDIPINGRNFMALVQIAPGVNQGNPNALSAGSRLDDRRPTSAASANGQPESGNNQLLDGQDNTDRYQGFLILRPSVEAIEQVRTDINTYSADVGRTAGAAVNVITKSGTNTFHGSLFEFFRNDVTDARNTFATSNIRKPELRQNQFGGSLSGPVMRDKLFFFADYEGFRRIDGTNSVYTTSVPSNYEQDHPGDISDLCAPITSTTCTAAQKITAVVNPTSLGYFQLFPRPNQTGTCSTVTGICQNNFIYNPALRQTIHLGDLRFDEHLTPHDTLFVRFSGNLTDTYIPNELPPNPTTGAGAAGVNAAPAPGYSHIQADNSQVAYTHIFSQNLLGQAAASYSYFHDNAVAFNYGKNLNDSAPYLIPQANECLNCSGLATISIKNSYAVLGDQTQAPLDRIDNNYELSAFLVWAHGQHTMKFGGQWIRRDVSVLQQTQKASITFKGNTPQITLPAFFKGSPFNFSRSVALAKPHLRTWEPAFYVQDDWHVLPKLTLNIGLRYEVFTPPTDVDSIIARYDLAAMQMIVSPNGGTTTDYSNINPRFGFAYNPKPGLVVRGGFGISHFPSDINTSFYLNNPPYGYQTGTLTLSTPISSGIPAAVAQATDNAALFGEINANPQHFHHEYTEQFNLLVQKEYRGTVLTAGYVGEVERHMLSEVPNVDVPTPAGPSAPNTAPPPAPYATQLPNVNTIDYNGDFASGSYNSLQMSVERRFSKGLTVNVNYTWAHGLDDALTTGEAAYGLIPTQISKWDYGNSQIDLRDRIAGTFTYELPFGKDGSTLYRAFTHGWQLNSLGFWQTGLPIIISSSYAQNGRAQINSSNQITVDRPDRVGDPYAPNPSPYGRWLNAAAFVKQPLGTQGNAGRNQVRGTHQRRLDVSLFRSITLPKNVTAQLRVECYNLTNTPNFALPSSAISNYSTTPDANGYYEATTDGNFGTIQATTQGFANRQLQFAARFVF